MIQNIKIWILIILFALPGCLAYYAYKHPQILSAKTNNKGQLLQPALQLSSLNTKQAIKKPNIIGIKDNNHWYLLLWQPSVCAKACMTNINRLARIHLALGRKFYTLNVGILTSDIKTISPALVTQWQKQAIAIYTLDAKDSQRLATHMQPGNILIANPQKYAILTYSNTDSLTNIFNDLQHLI